jgi:HK97 family phage major capsid protein
MRASGDVERQPPEVAPVAITRSNLVIPDQYVREIIQSTVEESVALQLMRRVTMPTGATHLPVMAALPSGGWVSPRDVGIKLQSGAVWDDVVLTAEELAVIVTVPEAVLEDANFDIFAEIQPRVSEKFGQLIDLACLFGSGAPSSFPASGVAGHAIAAGNHVANGTSAIDVAEDINQVMNKMENEGFSVEGFAARSGIKSMLRGLRSSQNVPIFQPSMQADAPPTLYGETILYSRNAGWVNATADLIAGDWDYSVIGIRQDMNIKVLTEATFTDGAGNVVLSLAETDQVALRCYMRVGFAIANPVTLLQATRASRSPFSVLQPHA